MVEVRLLGELEVVGDDNSVVEVRGRKQRTLLAALALHRGETVSLDRLVDVLWADGTPSNPANALQAQVAQLRRTLTPTAIETRPGGYALARDIDVDADRLERDVVAARAAHRGGDDATAAAMLRRALGAVRGEALVDFAFDDFATGERARLGELLLEAVELRVAADLACGRHDDLVSELDALCLIHPLRERLWACRMLALYRSGRQADALRAYDEARERLVEELGIDPGSELQQLHSAILRQDPALDLGPAAMQQAAPRTNLRPSLTRFVGRADDLRELGGACRSARLVTAIGPGGVGKTRLAVEVARELHAAGAEVWVVELAAVAEAAAVLPAIAGAIGVTDAGGPEAPTSSLDEVVRRHLAGRSVVVLLDNCEHLVDVAARTIDDLLAHLPGLRVLATSREPLGVPGEHIYNVGPLAADEAVELFVDRVAAVRRDLAMDDDDRMTIADICARLDALPLALELAAARTRTLPLGQLAARLDDRFRLLTGGARTLLPRQQTLRAVVDWSYDLLFEDEQILFSRLSVFSGGFTLDDAERVCSDDRLSGDAVVDLTFRLADKSLVTPTGDRERFTHLQTLLHYGRARLTDRGEMAVMRQRHADHFLAVAVDCRDRLRGSDALDAHRRLRAERDNLRSALDWLISDGDRAAALALATSLAWDWFTRADYLEGIRWLTDALGTRGEAPADIEAAAQGWLGYFVGIAQSHQGGVERTQGAVELARTSGSPAVIGEALLLHGSTLLRARHMETGIEATEEASVVAAAAGDEWACAIAQLVLASGYAPVGRLDDAARAAEDAITRLEKLRMPWLQVEPLGVIAGIREATGDDEGAASAYRTAIELSRTYEVAAYLSAYLLRLAALLARCGDDDQADGLYREAITASRSPNITGIALVGAAGVVRRRGDASEARALLERALRVYSEIGHVSGQASALVGMTWWSIATGDGDPVATAEQAQEIALATGDRPATRSARTALLAARAHVDPSAQNVDAFLQDADDRAGFAGAHTGVMDEPDIAALVSRFSELAST